jgi:hypothetical protein
LALHASAQYKGFNFVGNEVKTELHDTSKAEISFAHELEAYMHSQASRLYYKNHICDNIDRNVNPCLIKAYGQGKDRVKNFDSLYLYPLLGIDF